MSATYLPSLAADYEQVALLLANRPTMNVHVQASRLPALGNRQPPKRWQTCIRKATLTRMGTWLACTTAEDGPLPHTCSGWPCSALQVCVSMHNKCAKNNPSCFQLSFQCLVPQCYPRQLAFSLSVKSLNNCTTAFHGPTHLALQLHTHVL